MGRKSRVENGLFKELRLFNIKYITLLASKQEKIFLIRIVKNTLSF